MKKEAYGLGGDVVTRWEVRRAVWGLVKACGSLNGAAREMGVPANDVSRTLKRSNLLRDSIARYFGYEPLTVYVRKELLEGRRKTDEAEVGEPATEETKENVTETA